MKQIQNIEDAKKFVLGGKAHFTIVSKKTEVRFTFKLTKAKEKEVFWAYLLRGPNNEMDYKYIGAFANGSFYAKELGSTSVKALTWFLENLFADKLSNNLELWHVGKCARCGRKLTVPESIDSGFGPECRGK